MSYWLYEVVTSDITGGVGIQLTHHARITFNDTKTAMNYEGSYVVDGVGGSSATLQSWNLQITVNGALVVNDYNNSNTTPNYYFAATVPISVNIGTNTTVSINTSATGKGNSGIYSTNFSNVYEYNLIPNNFSDCLVLPYNSNYLMSLEPAPYTSGYSNLKFIKYLGSGYLIVLPSTSCTLDAKTVGSEYQVYGQNTGLILLRPSQTAWKIANVYRNDIQTSPTLPSPLPSGSKSVTASAGKINIYRVTNSTLSTSDNLCYLPSPSSATGKLCIVVYGGPLGKNKFASGNSNVLYFDVVGGGGNTLIDNPDGGFPFLFTDGPAKSTGVIFLSSGSKWCIMGWNQTIGQTWDTNADIGIPRTSIPASINILNFNDRSGNVYYQMPAYNAALAGSSSLIVCKSNTDTSPEGAIFHADVGTNRFNDGIYRIYLDGYPYSCMIFVSFIDTLNSRTCYYPIVSYIP